MFSIIVLPEIFKKAMKDSSFRKIITGPYNYKLQLYSAEGVIDELIDTMPRPIIKILFERVKIVPLVQYKDKLDYCNSIVREQKYAKYIAAAIHIGAFGIWSLKKKKTLLNRDISLRVLNKEMVMTLKYKKFKSLGPSKRIYSTAIDRSSTLSGFGSSPSEQWEPGVNNKGKGGKNTDVFDKVMIQLGSIIEKNGLSVLDLSKTPVQSEESQEIPLKKITKDEIPLISRATRIQLLSLDSYYRVQEQMRIRILVEESFQFKDFNLDKKLQELKPVSLKKVWNKKVQLPYQLFGLYPSETVSKENDNLNPTNSNNGNNTDNSNSNKNNKEINNPIVQLLRLFFDKNIGNNPEVFYEAYSVIIQTAISNDEIKEDWTVQDFIENDEDLIIGPERFKSLFGLDPGYIADLDGYCLLRIQYNKDENAKGDSRTTTNNSGSASNLDNVFIYLNDFFEIRDDVIKKVLKGNS